MNQDDIAAVISGEKPPKDALDAGMALATRALRGPHLELDEKCECKVDVRCPTIFLRGAIGAIFAMLCASLGYDGAVKELRNSVGFLTELSEAEFDAINEAKH